MIGRRPILAAAAAALGLFATRAHAEGTPVSVVAAENFYGDLAAQIGGRDVTVTSIISNPDADPHLFEASPSIARALSDARIVICNGAGYDPWMQKLLSASRSAARVTVIVSDLLERKTGENPHLWYNPAAMPAAARALATALSSLDPAHRADYEGRLRSFIESLAPLDAKIAAMRQRYAGTEITATEPIFGEMAQALGLKMLNTRFQLAVMNDTEPSAADVAAFERDLRTRRAKALIYNTQVTDRTTQRLLGLARRAHVPVVGVTETEPAGKSYQEWMSGQLDSLDRALSQPSS